MDNFFKHFRDNLDNQPEPAFEERDWLNLEKRLADKPKKHPLPILLLWLLTPLFLLSLAANGFQYNQLKNNQNYMDFSAQKTLVIQSDTIYKIKTIYERDTIYKTKIVYKTEIVYLPAKTDSLHTLALSNKTIQKGEQTIIEPIKSDKAIAQEDNNYGYKNLTINALDKINALNPSLLKLKNQPEALNLNLNPIVLNKKKTLRQHLETLRPTSYSMGISAGLAYPISNISSKPSGYSAGLEGIVHFSPHLSAWANAHFIQTSFQTDRMSDTLGIPVIAPPSNDFRFNLVKVNQPTVQYMGGLRYHFEPKKFGQPYIGLGYGAVTSLPYEVEYEFKNNNLGTVWDFGQQLNKRKTQWGFLLLEAGLEKHFSKHYRWQLGVNYRLKLLNTVQSYRLLSIKSGILFDF